MRIEFTVCKYALIGRQRCHGSGVPATFSTCTSSGRGLPLARDPSRRPSRGWRKVGVFCKGLLRTGLRSPPRRRGVARLVVTCSSRLQFFILSKPYREPYSNSSRQDGAERRQALIATAFYCKCGALLVRISQKSRSCIRIIPYSRVITWGVLPRAAGCEDLIVSPPAE